MNDQMTSTRREAYNALANLLTALGAGLGVWGVINLLEGCGNNHPAAKEQGGRQIKAGGNLVFLAAYLRNGTLPAPEIMEYLAAQ